MKMGIGKLALTFLILKKPVFFLDYHVNENI